MSNTKIVIGPARASFPALFVPQAMEEGQDKKYGITLLIDKSDTKQIKEIQKAIAAAHEAAKDSLPKNWQNPLKDGDEEKPDIEGYKGMMYISARSSMPPDVLNAARKPIVDPNDVYAGCYVFASVNFYAYTKGKKGVAAGLNGVMFAKHGQPFSSRGNVADDFKDISIEDVDMEVTGDDDDMYN